MVRLDKDELLDTKAVAQMLRCSDRSLANWRVRGGGPRFAKVGKCCRYLRSDVEAWVESRLRVNTSEIVGGDS